jgi:hypothetical protein
MAPSRMSATSYPQTLGQFIQSKAERSPDTIVLRFINAERPDEIVTHGSLAISAHKLAVTLRQRGITHRTT